MRFRKLTSLVALSAACACVTARPARVVATPNPEIRAVEHVASVRDYNVAVASVRAVLQRDFNIPHYPVDFYFFPDRQAFERGLIGVGYGDAFARDTARTMDAVGGYRRVLLNEAAFGRQHWPGRVASLAHELAHSLQYEFGGGRRGVSDQWLREGFAEWIGMHVLHRLRGLHFQEARRRYDVVVRRAGRSRVPALGEMVTFPQWVTINSARGVPAYAYAFLAVDFLIERHGIDAVFDYFKLFAATQDRTRNFRDAFGEDLKTFETALVQRLW